MTQARTGNADLAVTLEIYKLTVEMADRVSARRGSANQFYITVLTALTAVNGLLGTADPSWYLLIVMSLAGIAISLAWWLQLRSYRDLNKAKFATILGIESDLPCRPFTNEWDTLKTDPVARWRLRYAELGTVERFIPWVFVGIFVALALAAVVNR